MNTLQPLYRQLASALLVALFVLPVSAQDLSGLAFDQADRAQTATYYLPPNPASTEEPVDAMQDLIDEIVESENIPVEDLALSRVEWDDYGNRLEAALATDHLGLNRSALRLIIAYGDNFDLTQEAVFDVMRIYRDDDSVRARRMAVVALAEMNSDWALKFLERSSKFEKSETVKQTILAVLAHHARSVNPM